MKYNNFKEELVSRLHEELENSESTIIVRGISKNNGIVRDGLCIEHPRYNGSPIIYIDDMYAEYKRGEDMETIIKTVIDEMVTLRTHIDINELLGNWDLCKPLITAKMVNLEWNKENLDKKGILYREVLDLAVVAKIKVSEDEDAGIMTASVDEQMFSQWGISPEEFWMTLYSNIVNKEGYRVNSVTEILTGEDKTGEREDSMYILANKSGINGAICLLNTDALEKFGEQHGDFYLIPSSIHELILVPVSSGMETDALRETIGTVNKTLVDKSEVLSNNLYRYSLEKGVKLTIVE